MLVALIDDGIATDIYPEIPVKFDFVVTPDGSICPAKKQRVLTDHGTTSARIIMKYAKDEELTFYVLRIFDAGELKTTMIRLAAALNWCCRQDIPIVHMSVGSTRLLDAPLLRECVFRLLQKRITLVAAYSNFDEYTQPACFTGVFGVAADSSLGDDDYYVLNQADEKQIQIYASSRHALGRNVTQISNSYAAPTVTAHLYRILRAHKTRPTPTQLYAELAGRPVETMRLQPDFLYEAILCNIGRVHYIREALSFAVTKEVSTQQELSHALRSFSTHPVVVLPDSNTEKIFSKITLHCNVLLAGQLAHTAPQCSGTLWNEAKYVAAIQALPTAVPIAQEDVSLFGKGDAAVLLALAIKKQFEKAGLACCIISDTPMAYLYGMEYLPREADKEAVTNGVLRQYHPDILIHFMQNTQMSDANMTVQYCSGQIMTIRADVIASQKSLAKSCKEICEAVLQRMNGDVQTDSDKQLPVENMTKSSRHEKI